MDLHKTKILFMKFPAIAFVIVLCFPWTGCVSNQRLRCDHGVCIAKGYIKIKSDYTEKLDYQLLFKEKKTNGAKDPMILALPGRGQDVSAYLREWENDALRNNFGIVIPDWENSFSSHTVDLKAFTILMDYIKKTYPVDEKQMFLSGASAGAVIARSIMVESPEKWKGAILIASPPGSMWIFSVDPKLLPPMLILHGQRDQLFRYEEIEKDVARFKSLGLDVELIGDPSAAHEHKPEWNNQIFEWIKRKAR